MKRQSIAWKEILASHIWWGLKSKIYKEPLQLNRKKNWFKMGRELIQIDIFPKKTKKWSTGTWKDAQHHWSSAKCKSKPQWDITSCLLEWLLPKWQIIVGKDVEKRKPLCSVGGNVNWRSHYGKQYRGAELTWTSNSTSGYLSEGNEATVKKDNHVHCSIIYNSQYRETSVHQWMNG